MVAARAADRGSSQRILERALPGRASEGKIGRQYLTLARSAHTRKRCDRSPIHSTRRST